MIRIEPIFIKLAHFLGATTIIGKKNVDRNKKKTPELNRPKKYGYISAYFCMSAVAY